MENKDSFMQCPRCGSTVCYVQNIGTEQTALCLTCGYTTTSLMVEGTDTEKQVSEKQPQLYRDLKYVDSEKRVWYPAVITLPEKGMVYLDGTEVDNCEWVKVPFRRLDRRERRLKNLPKEKQFLADMDHSEHFGRDGFIEAAAALGVV